MPFLAHPLENRFRSSLPMAARLHSHTSAGKKAVPMCMVFQTLLSFAADNLEEIMQCLNHRQATHN